MRERTTHARLNDHLAIHILELPKARGLSTSPDEVPSVTERRLRMWSRFFLSQERGELEALAQEDPIMREAKETLEELSADPQTRLAAQVREMHLRAYYNSLAAEREAGEAAGLLRGKAEARAETLLRLLSKRFGPLAPATVERVRDASVELVEGWIDRIFEMQSVDEILRE